MLCFIRSGEGTEEVSRTSVDVDLVSGVVRRLPVQG